MENLLEETIKILKEYRKEISDIKWIGSYDYYVNIDDFLRVADTNYDSGYGRQEVATNLFIVGDDWWLERHEYDGSEWWEFKSIPIKPNKVLPNFKSLTEGQARENNIDVWGWCSLEKLNGLRKDD